MAEEKELAEKQLEVLHDHYKETFARIREAEALRDRLFLWVIALFALLILEIGYPAAIAGVLGKLTISGQEINIQALPLQALLDVSWVLMLTVGLQYCRTSLLVNRQYPYLHELEVAISPKVGGGNLYQREGKVYATEYPLLLDVAWIAYGVLFPLIMLLATLGLICWEWKCLPKTINTIFDTAIALLLVLYFFLYRFAPECSSRWRKWKAHKRSKHVMQNPNKS